ncbi:MAG TPA: hypothetical protein PKI35_00720 [Bacteroidales bacterium]|nr:hypothetical protein [Bacteroidales bacterium]
MNTLLIFWRKLSFSYMRLESKEMENNYYLLLRKIDAFIRKYYKNQLIRGAIYSLALLALFFILISALEYFSWFSTTIRTILFYSYLTATAFILGRFVIIPLLKLRRIGKIISHEEAANIIGRHFTDVKDILLNTLQLKNQCDDELASRDLIEASIDQKTEKLRPVNFTGAIDLKQNRKYLKFALPPAILILAVLIISPSAVTEPATRILHHKSIFEKPAPFEITVLNSHLKAVQQEDFELKIKLTGNEIPGELFLRIGDAVYRMEKENNIRFNYTFKNIQQRVVFNFEAGDYNSKEYTLEVLPKPIILSFDIQADYPQYTGRKPEKFENAGDITVPAGTLLTWKFYLKDSNVLYLRLFNKVRDLPTKNSNVITWSTRVNESAGYSVMVGNEHFKNIDSLQYFINVIPDLYPEISVNEYSDSIYENRLYYKGSVKDDYGFSRLAFCYTVKSEGSKATDNKVILKDISLEKNVLQQPFYFFMDVAALSLKPGDILEYYFEVWDNDAINHFKSTRSQKGVFRIPTVDEIEKKTEEKNEDIKDRMETAISQSRKLQQQIENFDRKLIEKDEIGWQEKQQLQQMIDKQKQLQNEIEEIKKENHDKALKEEQFKDIDQSIMEKQQKLEELFDQILPDEMKKMYEELQQLLEKVDKEKVQDMLEEMKMNNEDMEKQLDRNLEMFKQLEFEKKLQETIDKIKESADKQEKLSEKTGDAKREELESISREQDVLNKQFDNIRNDLNDLEKKNSELSDPNNLSNTDPMEESIQKEMDNSKEQLENKSGKNASKSQKSAGEKMQELGQKLENMQNEMNEENNAEDIETLRQILENLVDISFGQEKLMTELNTIGVNNPKYLQVIQDQKNLKDDLKMVEDSLFSLSKRQSAVEPFVMREINAIDNNMEETLDALNGRTVNTAKSKQQYIMTSVNNIALMLAESMKEMQSNMSFGGSGKSKSQCNNPKAGNGKSGKMNSLRQLQEQLNKQLGEMKNEMDKNGSKPGNKGSSQMSEKLARMAAQQEALRKQLQEIGEEMLKEGYGDGKSIKQTLQNMEQTETDIVNKRITRETMLRQQEIVTRLLESEKAEQKRDLDEKRESNEGKDRFYENPAAFFDYKKLKEKDNEMIRVVPPSLKPFYKRKANAYFLSFD